MGAPRVYSEYDEDRPRPIVDCSVMPSMTRQSEKDGCDINLIMKRYEKTGELPPFVNEGWFGDVTEIGDYRDIRARMLQVSQVFEQLPAVVRGQFENDPAGFLDYATDPANRDQLIEWGLIPKGDEVVPVPPPVPVVTGPPPSLSPVVSS